MYHEVIHLNKSLSVYSRINDLSLTKQEIPIKWNHKLVKNLTNQWTLTLCLAAYQTRILAAQCVDSRSGGIPLRMFSLPPVIETLPASTIQWMEIPMIGPWESSMDWTLSSNLKLLQWSVTFLLCSIFLHLLGFSLTLQSPTEIQAASIPINGSLCRNNIHYSENTHYTQCFNHMM